MTVLQRIKAAVNSLDCSQDDINKIIALAYMIGKEEATREVSDQYAQLIKEQRKRADNCRYKHLANAVIGDQSYIYFGDYDNAMTAIFGSDDTTV